MGRIDKKGGLSNPFVNNGSDSDESQSSSSFFYPPDMTNEEAFQAFSGVNLAEARKQIKVEYINIDAIYPDRTQPRRSIPLSVRGGQPITPGTVGALFERWLEAANEQREQPLDLEKYLAMRITERSDAMIDEDEKKSESVPFQDEGASGHPIEIALMRVVELAASIREVGLMNPITVALRPDTNYVIETGERRWLAYHLLRWQFGDEDDTGDKKRGKVRWDAIPAIKVEEPDVWRQAIENNARDNLNAIGKARQLALLLMHMHGPENFQPLDEFIHEQDFYAQVADGNKFRILRGKSEQLAGALNLKSPKQIRDYRGLLRIPPEVWDAADEEDWPEGKIRDAVRSVPNGTVSAPKRPHASVPNGTVNPEDKLLAPIRRMEKRYNEKRLKAMSEQERALLLDELNSLTRHIKRLVKQIED